MIDMNGLGTKVYVNIIPLDSYDCLIGMDWLEKNRVILDRYNKTIICLDEFQQRNVRGIQRFIAIGDISAMHLKKSFKKGCHIFSSHMEEVAKYKVARIEEHLVLMNFEDVFREIPGFSLKRDIDFSIIWCQKLS
jgi:hypothetical protein